MGGIRGIVNGASRSQQKDYDAFCDRWQLNFEASERLRLLPGDMRQTVIDGFDPKSSTRDVSSKLMGFIKSKEKGIGKGGREPLGDASSWRPVEGRRSILDKFC